MNIDTEQKRKRRKRVQSIKRMIIALLAVWMIVMLSLSVFLLVRVNNLQKQINTANERIEKVSGLQDDLSGKIDTLEEAMEESAVSDAVEEPETEKHNVYLTFDITDPGEEDTIKQTEDLLSLLDKNDLKATFFVKGTEDEESLSLYKKIAMKGHTLGITSYSGGYEIYTSSDSFTADLSRMNKLYSEVTGSKPKYYRFPGGSKNKVANENMEKLQEILEENGLTFVDYNIYGNDIENILESVVKYKTSVIRIDIDREEENLVSEVSDIITGLKEKKDTDILPITEDTY